jgi:hypothetical protein
MVRPERRVVLTGGSPVLVSAGAPGSRLQPEGETRPSRAECQSPLKEREANRRAATIRERNSLVKSSAERCPWRIPERSQNEGLADLGTIAGMHEFLVLLVHLVVIVVRLAKPGGVCVARIESGLGTVTA